jgi:predicted secreted protein
MKWTSIAAIYFLFWALSFFLVLPFRLRSSNDDEAFVPGQAESAPPRFSFLRTVKWTTAVAVVLFGLYYANYINRWIAPDMIDFFSGAAERSHPQ